MRRIGLEVELLAPPGHSRETLARALAKRWRGLVAFGSKYHGAGTLPDGRPDCRLTEALKVNVGARWMASFVDDPTIVDDLPPAGRPRLTYRTDDVRLAAWIERRCWAKSPAKIFETLKTSLDGRETDEGWVDPWGHPLVLRSLESTERARVCEVVLRPLAGRELRRVLTEVMQTATELGFTVPAEAAVHAHFDADPFRSTAALRQLVLSWAEEREAWLQRFEPNPRCRKLGPFPENVVRVAQASSSRDDFDTVAAGYLLAGLHRAVDLNLLGLVERFPKQPTIEVRCLPGSLDEEATLERLALAESFLDRVLRRAKVRSKR